MICASYEFSMSGKRLELEIAPGVKRVAVIRDPSVPAGSGGLAAVAPSLSVESACAMPAKSSTRSRPSREVRAAA
jgi:hypothetical protein